MNIKILKKLVSLSGEKDDLIISIIANDIYGGKIMKCETLLEDRYYNLINDEIVDFTTNDTPDYIGEEVKKEYLLNNLNVKQKYKDLLDKIRTILIEKDFEEITNDSVLNEYKEYFNNYFIFSDFDIFQYSKDDDFEYATIDLAAGNTGLIIHMQHNLKTDEYKYFDVKLTLPIEFIKRVFEIAREYKDNIKLEDQLTDLYTKTCGI